MGDLSPYLRNFLRLNKHFVAKVFKFNNISKIIVSDRVIPDGPEILVKLFWGSIPRAN